MGHQVGCYLSFAQVEQLDDLAHAAGKCRSALLRDIIADFLNDPSTEIKDLSPKNPTLSGLLEQPKEDLTRYFAELLGCDETTLSTFCKEVETLCSLVSTGVS